MDKVADDNSFLPTIFFLFGPLVLDNYCVSIRIEFISYLTQNIWPCTLYININILCDRSPTALNESLFTAHVHLLALVLPSVAQLCLTLCNPMDYTFHGILQAR